jgi:hypothetical protein
VLELLRDDAQLLAIADAVAATQRMHVGGTYASTSGADSTAEKPNDAGAGRPRPSEP